MKHYYFTLSFFWVFSFSVYAQTTSSQLVSLEAQNAPLIDLLNELETDYNIIFYYKIEWLEGKTASISIQDNPINQVITTLLKETNLSFAPLSQNTFVIAPRADLEQEFSQRDYLTAYQNQTAQQKKVLEENWLELGDSTKNTQRETVILTGYIKDSYNSEKLQGATIQIEGTNASIVSDPSGNFEIELPVGDYIANIRYIGFEPARIPIRVLSNDRWNIQLDPEAYTLSEIVISEQTDDVHVKSVDIGMNKLTPLEIKSVPAFLGEADIIKSLLTLPGVNTIGEGASGFNVRGGRIDQNLIMQDEALIFNSSHVLGFFSVFNPDAVREVTLYKGHIPAHFGGRVSSVLDVKLKNANYKEIKLNGGIGVVSSRLSVELPVIKDKTSLLLAGRSSYSDWILRRIPNPDIQNSSAFFYDMNAKLSHRFSDKTFLELSYYRSVDNFQFSTDYGFSWDTETASLLFSQTLIPNLNFSLPLVYGNNRNESFDPAGQDAFRLTNGVEYYKAKPSFTYELGKQKIIAGAEWIQYNSQPEQIRPETEFSGIGSRSVEKDNAEELSFFLNNEVELNSVLSFSVGLRYTQFQQIGNATEYAYQEGVPKTLETLTDTLTFGSGEVIQKYDGWEPRFSLRIGLDGSSSIKLSYNRMNQYIHLVSNTAAAVPVDVWQVSNQHVLPQRAHNFSLGYFKNFMTNQWETSFEVFYKKIDHLLEYKDLPTLLLNPQLETELLSARGKSYGAELYLKRTVGRSTGWLSYTFSRTLSRVEGDTREETINRGEWFPSNFDKPHTLNISYNYKISKKSKVALNFTYSTGRPISAPVANYFQGTVVIPHFSERNQFRIPDYHRMDLAYTITPNVIRDRRYKGSWTFSLYNLYSRNNAFSVFFKRDLGNASNAFKLSVLGSIFPAITYNFEF